MSGKKQLYLDLIGRDKGAIPMLGKLGDEADKTGKRFAGASTLMLGAGGAAAAGLWKAGQASANLSASISTTDQVFGDAKATIDEFGKTSADSVGLSSRAFHEQTAILGSFIKNMGFTQTEAADMSVALVKMGADMGAAFNKSPEEAISAIGAAFRGETDPIEQFGISIKEADIKAQAAAMGLDMSTTSAAKHSKALAVMALVQKQTTDITGQFGKEADTVAGKQARATASMEDAKAKIGEGFVPIMEKVIGLGGLAATGFEKLDGAVGGNASQFLAWGAAGLLAAGAIGKVKTSIGPTIESLKTMNAASVEAGGSFSSLGAKMAGAAGVAAAAMVSYELISNRLEKAAGRANDLGDVLDKRMGKQTSLDGLNLQIEQTDQAMRDVAETARSQLNPFEAWDLVGQARALGESEDKARRLRFEIAKYADTNKVSADEATKSVNAQKQHAEAQKTLADATKGTTEALKAQIDMQRAATDPFFAAEQAVNKNTEAQQKAFDTSLALTAAQAEYNRQVAIFGAWSPQAATAQNALNDATSAARTATTDATKSAQDRQFAEMELEQTIRGQAGTIDEQIAILQRLVDQGYITSFQADEMGRRWRAAAGDLGNLGREATETERLLKRMGEIADRYRTGQVTVGSSIRMAPSHAEGAYYPAKAGGSMARVAEGGDGEWVLPDRMMQGALRQAAGGGAGDGISVSVQALVADRNAGRAVVEALEEYLRGGGQLGARTREALS